VKIEHAYCAHERSFNLINWSFIFPSLVACRHPSLQPAMEMQPHRAPPLSRGMWAGSIILEKGSGRKDQQGGPRKWEAHTVRHKVGHDNHCGSFLPFPPPFPALTNYLPNADAANPRTHEDNMTARTTVRLHNEHGPSPTDEAVPCTERPTLHFVRHRGAWNSAPTCQGS